MNGRAAMVLRALAIAIAVLAVVDPAIMSTRHTRPIVAVLAGESSDTSRVATLVKELGRSFTVVPASVPAAATVIVGDALPASVDALARPVVAVRAPTDAGLTLESVEAPSRASLDGRIPVNVVVRVSGLRGRQVTATLRDGGLAVDRTERAVATDSARLEFPLSSVPSHTGAATLSVQVTAQGTPSVAADVMTDVRAAQWRILFHDHRPTWLSTFVRRSLELDARFAVASRTVTSRNMSADAGGPPALDDALALSRFDVVVIGAPSALTDAEVRALDSHMRARGGTVVLLLDAADAPRAARLADVAAWSSVRIATSEIAARDTSLGSVTGGELLMPSELPAGARATAVARDRVPVWESPVGAGHLVVFGATDAWKHRDAPGARFDGFWRTLVADAAAQSIRPIDVRLSHRVAGPNERVGVDITLRDVAGAAALPGEARATVTARLQSGTTRQVVRAWPGEIPGHFQSSMRAPSTPGEYRLVVSSGSAEADVPFVVLPAVARPAGADGDLLDAYARSTGGTTLRTHRADSVRMTVAALVARDTRPEPWHPMRSAWWIIPFSLGLAAEWWWRRRNSLA